MQQLQYQILTILFIINSFTIVTVQGQKDWQEFLYFDGKFKVQSPANLTEKLDTITTPIGNLVYHTFFHQPDIRKSENAMYMISYVDYPEGAMHSDSTELLSEFFKGTIEAATESVKGELLYDSETTLRDYPGRVWRIDYLEGGAVIKTRAYMVNNRYYSIQTIALKDRNLNKASEVFLDSFELL